jgi:hypothetical protein
MKDLIFKLPPLPGQVIFFPTPYVSQWLLITGISLFLSGIVHHFLVLCPLGCG